MSRPALVALGLLPLLACPKPAPAPAAPAPAPALPDAPAANGLDGWHLLQTDGTWWWTEIPAHPDLLEDRSPSPPTAAPPDAPDPVLARAWLAKTGAVARPVAWTWPAPDGPDPVLGPLVPRAPELVSAQLVLRPDATVALRAWFRPLDAEPPTLAVTDGTRGSTAPTGARQSPVRDLPPSCETLQTAPVPLATDRAGVPTAGPWRCSLLPLADGQLVATEIPVRCPDADADAPPTGSCATAAVRYPHGGVRWLAPSCRTAILDGDPDGTHLLQGVRGSATGPSLPVGWFAGDAAPIVVLNRFRGPVADRCLARIPAVDRPFEPTACVAGPAGRGGF